MQRTISKMDKEVTEKINAIKKSNVHEKKELIKSFGKKQVHSREVTREIEAQYNSKVADLKCQYEQILLKNEEELTELKKFKKESDLVTGRLIFDADVKRKRELDQLSKQHESKLSQTRRDLEKEHLRELERVRKKHETELKKAANLVERLRREKRNKRNVMTKRLKNSNKKKVR